MSGTANHYNSVCKTCKTRAFQRDEILIRYNIAILVTQH